jgi:hypothetical protein
MMFDLRRALTDNGRDYRQSVSFPPAQEVQADVAGYHIRRRSNV